jgi:HPt (histidine-containing phosphotransfer) domain-containing protein
MQYCQINIQYFYFLVADDREAVLDMLYILRKNLKEFPALMQNAFALNQLQELRRLAHKFRSSISYTKATVLDQTLMTIEEKIANLAQVNHLASEMQTLTYQVALLSDEVETLILQELAKI